MSKVLNQRWDLDSLFPGGSESSEYAAYLDQLETDIAAFRKQVQAARTPASPAEVGAWIGLLDTFQEIARRQRDAGAFVGCLNAQNMKDDKAKLLGGRLKQMSAAFSSVLNLLDAQLVAMSEPVWKALLADPRCKEIGFNLAERRSRAAEKMGPERESLAGDLAVDGYHAWGDLYNVLIGRTH
ncbi:MAG: hypothetical protein ACM3XM_07795, partial [Mycobacterium leprae]